MQDKGFVYGPSPEIYGGLAGFFDYGPMGKLLKNNVKLKYLSTFKYLFKIYLKAFKFHIISMIKIR